MIREDLTQGLLKNQYKGQNYVDLVQIKDFSSVQNLIKMPHIRKIISDQNVFPPVEKDLIDSKVLSDDLKKSMIKLRQNLRNQFSTHDNPQNFKFIFPQSKFPAVPEGQKNLISYQQKNIVEQQDTFKDRLSPQQIQQISQTGQFKVRSNQQYITLPYVWKINDFLFKGKKNIQLIWNTMIGKSFSFIYKAFTLLKETIPEQIKQILKIPKRTFSLIFGSKAMIVSFSVNYQRQIAKDFWNQVLIKHYVKSNQWGYQIFDYLDAQYNAQIYMTIKKNGNDKQDYERKIKAQLQSLAKYQKRLSIKKEKMQKIRYISSEFNSTWQKAKKKIFNQVSAEYDVNRKVNNYMDKEIRSSEESEQLLKIKNDNQILQKFNDKKFSFYTNFLQKKLPNAKVPLPIIQAIITLLTIMQIMNKKNRKIQQIKLVESTRISNQIRKNHSIKSLDNQWYHKQFSSIYNPIQKKLYEQYFKDYTSDQLENKLSIKQKKVFQLWKQYKNTIQNRIQAKKIQKPQLQAASRTFYSTFHLLPPYQIFKTENSYNGDPIYTIIKQQRMKIETNSYFWKFKLYFMRIKCWTINCVVFLIYFCYKGPFGLRCLYGIDQFSYDQDVNVRTGEVINSTRKPVLGVFIKVLNGITKSRDSFQALPDRGLFGKKFSRLFNYLQCYIFRLFIVGIILTLIFYPIAIIISSVITGLLILTIWAWMPIVLLVTYLFNIFVYQFQSSSQPYGFWIRAFPLFSLILCLIFSLIKIILIILLFTIISPIICIFIILFAVLYRIWRAFTDCIMLFLIRNLGRTPSNNTSIAKKISGPGMSKQFYMSINQEDVYILVQSQLQRMLMQQYNRIVSQKIVQPVKKLNQVLQLLLKPLNNGKFQNGFSNFNSSRNYNYYQNNSYQPQNKTQNPIHKSVSDLDKNYQKAYSNHMARYPNRPNNIRFTQDQIDNYFENTVAIVNNFIQKNKIHGWIFEEKHLIIGDYQELTRKIWQNIFGCGEQIFQPLQKIDQRFKLQDQYKNQDQSMKRSLQMKKNVHSVLQALQGEVELKPRKANISAFHRGLLSNQIAISGVEQIMSFIQLNSQDAVNIPFYELKTILFPHLRIQEVIKKQNYFYQLKIIQQENSN